MWARVRLVHDFLLQTFKVSEGNVPDNNNWWPHKLLLRSKTGKRSETVPTQIENVTHGPVRQDFLTSRNLTVTYWKTPLWVYVYSQPPYSFLRENLCLDQKKNNWKKENIILWFLDIISLLKWWKIIIQNCLSLYLSNLSLNYTYHTYVYPLKTLHKKTENYVFQWIEN